MPREGTTALGIDAAWTEGNPSGVALVQYTAGRWICHEVASSYQAFCHRLGGSTPAATTHLGSSAILKTCVARTRTTPAVIAIDMPLAIAPIVGRRVADNEVSLRFGHRNCSTHSPNLTRPGIVGRRLQHDLATQGFELVTGYPARAKSVVEVYPHPALLGLTGSPDRLPYKVSRRRRYWPTESDHIRKQRIVQAWTLILRHLGQHIDEIHLPLPLHPEAEATSALKAIEDALDSLVCAWVGIQFLEGRAVPLGDTTAAVWIPSCSMTFAKPHAA
jgi:predicted RNase H-like nuclease